VSTSKEGREGVRNGRGRGELGVRNGTEWRKGRAREGTPLVVA